jgi:hypothetical protein
LFLEREQQPLDGQRRVDVGGQRGLDVDDRCQRASQALDAQRGQRVDAFDATRAQHGQLRRARRHGQRVAVQARQQAQHAREVVLAERPPFSFFSPACPAAAAKSKMAPAPLRGHGGAQLGERLRRELVFLGRRREQPRRRTVGERGRDLRLRARDAAPPRQPSSAGVGMGRKRMRCVRDRIVGSRRSGAAVHSTM